jgi:glycosyltransferase involved in cell wall biosynthesis
VGPEGHPPGRPDVLFALVGDVRSSSRALRQLRALRTLGLTVEVLTFGPPLTDRLGEGLPLDTRLRARVLPAPGGRGPRFFWAAHRLFRAAALAAPAAVYHASDLHLLPALAAAARRHRARLVYDAREYYAGLDVAAARPWVGLAWGAVERAFAPRADLVLTVNDAIADRLAARRGIARPVVIHNVAERWSVPERGALRVRLRLAPGRPVVLYQGLFRPGRGLDHLIAAMAGVPGADLVLIGEGPEEADLRRRAEGLGGRVHFLPFTPPDALAALTADADLGAIPVLPISESHRMGLPNKLFEFAAAGLPILAGVGVEPMCALVARYGAGPIVDPRDHGALADAVRAALFDADARARWRAGAARLHADFSWERERERFGAAYAALLA